MIMYSPDMHEKVACAGTNERARKRLKQSASSYTDPNIQTLEKLAETVDEVTEFNSQIKVGMADVLFKLKGLMEKTENCSKGPSLEEIERRCKRGGLTDCEKMEILATFRAMLIEAGKLGCANALSVDRTPSEDARGSELRRRMFHILRQSG